MERLYTIPETAEYLRVTRAAVYKWIREGRIGVVYVGSERRITQSAIDAFVQESTDRQIRDRGGTIEGESRTPSRAAA